jgi:hypothetical protein
LKEYGEPYKGVCLAAPGDVAGLEA